MSEDTIIISQDVFGNSHITTSKEAVDILWDTYEMTNLKQFVIDIETEEKLFGCFLEVTQRMLKRRFEDWKNKQLAEKPKSD